jgi:hypothetical protein
MPFRTNLGDLLANHSLLGCRSLEYRPAGGRAPVFYVLTVTLAAAVRQRSWKYGAWLQ